MGSSDRCVYGSASRAAGVACQNRRQAACQNRRRADNTGAGAPCESCMPPRAAAPTWLVRAAGPEHALAVDHVVVVSVVGHGLAARRPAAAVAQPVAQALVKLLAGGQVAHGEGEAAGVRTCLQFMHMSLPAVGAGPPAQLLGGSNFSSAQVHAPSPAGARTSRDTSLPQIMHGNGNSISSSTILKRSSAWCPRGGQKQHKKGQTVSRRDRHPGEHSLAARRLHPAARRRSLTLGSA